MSPESYLTKHGAAIAQLLTQHAATLPDTLAAANIRCHICDICAALSGAIPANPAKLCLTIYTLLAEIADAHSAACGCTGRTPCPYLKSILARRASMARAAVIF